MYKNNFNNSYSAYQRNEIINLTPIEIVVRLYQALESSLYAAKEAISNGQTAIRGEKLSHALSIVGELQASLNFREGGEIAESLYDLYGFMTKEILFANMKNDTDRIDNVLKTLKPLFDAWVKVKNEKQPHAPPSRATGGESLRVQATC